MCNIAEKEKEASVQLGHGISRSCWALPSKGRSIMSGGGGRWRAQGHSKFLLPQEKDIESMDGWEGVVHRMLTFWTSRAKPIHSLVDIQTSSS